MMTNVVHGGAAPKLTKRVFYSGTDTCAVGEAMCYNWDALTVTAENTATTGRLATISAANWTDARRVQVEDPTYANNMHFAGIVSRASDGVVGPNWIEIHVPGSVCEIRTVATVSIGISGTHNTGAMLTFTVGTNSVGAATTNNGRFEKPGFPGEGSATLLAEGAASVPGDSYLKMAHLQVGPPSGGVQCGTLISTLASVTAIKHGVINLNNTDLTSSAETGATISVSAGKFFGQRIGFIGPTAANSVAVAVSFLTAVVAGLTTGYVVCNQVTISDPAESVVATWEGACWHVVTTSTWS